MARTVRILRAVPTVVSGALFVATVAAWNWGQDHPRRGIAWGDPVNSTGYAVFFASGRASARTITVARPGGPGPGPVVTDDFGGWGVWFWRTTVVSYADDWTRLPGVNAYVTGVQVSLVWPLVLSVGLPLAWGVRTWRRGTLGDRRAAAGLCRACGYDCRATPDRCPECGTVSKGNAEAQRRGGAGKIGDGGAAIAAAESPSPAVGPRPPSGGGAE